MTQTKLKAIVCAITVFVVVTICVMLIVLTVQFVQLNRLQAQKAQLDTKITQIKNENLSKENQKKFLENKDAVEDWYRAQGYGKDGEIIYK